MKANPDSALSFAANLLGQRRQRKGFGRDSTISFGAQLMGRVKSKKKAAASRRNGKLGGRKKKGLPQT